MTLRLYYFCPSLKKYTAEVIRNNAYQLIVTLLYATFRKNIRTLNIDNIYFSTNYIHCMIKEIVTSFFCYIFIINH